MSRWGWRYSPHTALVRVAHPFIGLRLRCSFTVLVRNNAEPASRESNTRRFKLFADSCGGLIQIELNRIMSASLLSANQNNTNIMGPYTYHHHSAHYKGTSPCWSSQMWSPECGRWGLLHLCVHLFCWVGWSSDISRPGWNHGTEPVDEREQVESFLTRECKSLAG